MKETDMANVPEPTGEKKKEKRPIKKRKLTRRRKETK
jgi:hypothetical protein